MFNRHVRYAGREAGFTGMTNHDPGELFMKDTALDSIRHYTMRHGLLMGVARADTLNEKAPAGFRPEDLMQGARSVLVLAKPLSLGVFLADGTMFYQRSAHSYYTLMDEAANMISSMIEKTGSRALPVPAYSPLRFQKGEPRGLISLKHVAAESGLGRLGRNTLLIHPEFGNIMRLGALVTDMDWPEYSAPLDFNPCPKGCHACERLCPIGAIRDGSVDKVACLGKCVKHVLLPPSFMLPIIKYIVARSIVMTRFMELLSLNFFETYGIGCMECLKACIHFPGNRKGSTERPTSSPIM